MPKGRRYELDYKGQAVKLANEIGLSNAAKELEISKNTLAGWVRASHIGTLDMGADAPATSRKLTASEEMAILRHKNLELEKENKKLRDINAFLEEASAFFAASRQKSVKRRD